MEKKRKINVLIVDDDDVAREEARRAVSLFVEEKRVLTASDSLLMMRALQSNRIDLAFLDMEMPDTDGFSIADYLIKAQPDTKFVFLTGHTELGAKSYDYEPLDFLIKPINVMRLRKTFERYDRIKAPERSEGSIALETSAGFVLVEPNDILYISRDSRKAVVHCKGAEYVVNNALTELELMFADYGLMRCHQSFLLSLRHVKSVEKSGLGRTFHAVLDTGEQVPVSREKFLELKELLAKNGARFV